ncbi:MAG: transcriptional regulator with GAF, ATPase, and Fis domain [Myxococcota bacterium]|jgi:transcriptional regulator with GAF, ATPase, and Fis domain
MRELAQLARQVAVTDLPVLVQGETGTGKEVVCQALHTWSDRREGPYIKLNCAAIPEALVESELFGHVKGAFSGADRSRDGRFVTANGGTLLLDEIGELPLSAQAKLLRVLQEGQFEPVGSDETISVDVRVLAATNVDLHAAVADGRFRQDLMYRLAVFPLTLPPLRSRAEEIAPIAESFLHSEHRRSRRGPWSLPEATLEVMRAAPWAGNVRELLNALERATIVVRAGPLSPRDLGLGAAELVRTVPTPVVAHDLTWEANERAYLEQLLDGSDGRLYGSGGAAERAGLKPTTLRSKLVRFGLR